MIERVVRNDEVVGLIPIWSTTFRLAQTNCRNVGRVEAGNRPVGSVVWGIFSIGRR